jgi:hypothetical protein
VGIDGPGGGRFASAEELADQCRLSLCERAPIPAAAFG